MNIFNIMEKPKTTIGPFRATKLWNTIIGDFRSGIPLKRHRWRMRYFDNCFTSTEAVDWLHDYLCHSENFGPWVTRSQVVLLLQKFVQSKIIEEVRGPKGATTVQAVFEDNGHLYKFLPVSPMKKLRSALSSRSSIQSLSPSPKPRKTSARTKSTSGPPPRPMAMRDVQTTEGGPSHGQARAEGRTGTGQVARPLAMRDVNVDVHQPRDDRRQLTKELPRCTLIARPLTVEQVEEVWKSATLKRLQRLLWLSSLDGLLDDTVIVPSDIIHNCTHINRNGVVQLLNKENDLPHWVLSAMRCLANWPSKIDSELPSYPGFERDVFKTISNYFQNLSEPLITYSRYNLVVEAFVSMECRDRGIVPGQEVVTVYTGLHRGLTSFQSVESLMLNMTTRGQQSSTNTPNMERRNPKARAPNHGPKPVRRSTSFGQVDGMLRSDTPHLPPKVGRKTRMNQQFGSVDAMAGKSSAPDNGDIHDARVSRSNLQRVSNKADDYGFVNMPPMYPSKHSARQMDAEISSVSDQSHYENTQSISPHLMPRKCSSLINIQDAGKKSHQARPKTGGLFTSKKFGSAAELFNKLVKKKSPSQPVLGGAVAKPDKKMPRSHATGSQPLISPGLAPPPSYPVYSASPSEAAATHTSDASCQTVTPDTQPRPYRISPPYPPPLRATLSFSEISSHPTSTTPQGQGSTTPTGLPSAIVGSQLHCRSTSDLQTSTPVYASLGQIAQGRLQRHESITSISSLYLNDDRSYCLEALRLCLLLLPAAQRRALHLLLRLMSKMEHNKQLHLCTNRSTRQLLLETFSRCILRCEEEVDLDESLAVRIVAYLLDHHTTLFNIPQELREDIEERLTYLKRSQIKYEADVENIQPAGFCAQVSVEEYEKQKTVSSQQAIVDLLDNIISDITMSHKDKKKKLKLFQKAYPEIYHRRLPTSSSEAALFPAQPKIKQPMLNVKRSLSRLKPIR